MDEKVVISFNSVLPANQRSGTMVSQPLRFSGRKPGYPMQLCMTATSAAYFFRGKVCMSSNAVDLSFSEGKTPEQAKRFSEAQLHFHAPFSQASITASQHFPYSTFVTDAAIGIRNGTFCAEEPFRAFKLATPEHVAIALWDMKENVMEIFDPSGSDTNDKDTIFQESLLKTLFSKGADKKPDRVAFVNPTNLQGQGDTFCQTWIYWFLYERTVNKKNAEATILTAAKLHPQQRADMIRSFWHFLNQSRET